MRHAWKTHSLYYGCRGVVIDYAGLAGKDRNRSAARLCVKLAMTL